MDWIKGKFRAPNESGGFHGILKEWWEKYSVKNLVLLVTEPKNVAKKLSEEYGWDCRTLNMFGDNSDYNTDICGDISWIKERFGLIICQTTLEHVYDPYGAMRNMTSLLEPNGIILIHTHNMKMPIHRHPRDYFRFIIDWFQDIAIKLGIEVLEIHEESEHFFAAYKKTIV